MPYETRYVRPPASVLDDLATRALAISGDTATAVEWVEHGSNTLVALGDQTAVRMARQRSAGPELLRAQRVVDALPDLPFDVPRSRAEPVDIDGFVALAVRRLRGTHHPQSAPDLGTLRDVLEVVHDLDVTPWAQHLAPRRAFCGGERLGKRRCATERFRSPALTCRRRPRRGSTHWLPFRTLPVPSTTAISA